MLHLSPVKKKKDFVILCNTSTDANNNVKNILTNNPMFQTCFQLDGMCP